ncbi:MAG: T9SS type A sorting domain-containing protein, partial [Ferruginibacter sp.]|nr:T9SS type A sorting domain-containing protein [Ferruginibacter sp.]
DPASVTIIASDVDNASLKVTAVAGLPSGLSISPAIEVGNTTGTWTVSGNVTAAPGIYNVAVTISDGILSTVANFRITVIQENAIAQYTGGEFASTGSATATTANIRLSATVTDSPDANRGDIRNALVRFKIQPYDCDLNMTSQPVVYTSWRTVSLINLADATIGTAFLDTTFNVGTTCNAKLYDITAEVGNYYTGSSDAVTVSVSKSLNDFITGGGHIVNSSGTANKSGGIYKSTDNTKTNWGFNVKRDKNNLKGNVNIIIRSGTKTYQVKGIVSGSNGTLSINVTDPNNKKAIVTAKANMIDLATGLTVAFGNNATLELKMNDKGEPGANIDTYGITIWGTNNTLLYSSNWTGTVTNEVAINGGNIQVRSAVAAKAITSTEPVAPLIPEELTIKAFPNPSINYFIVNVRSKVDETVYLRVVDLRGRSVYTTKGSSNQTYKFGEDFSIGSYFLEVIKGTERRTLKLIKLK